MIKTPLRIATRGSTLAMWQAHFVGDQLQSHGQPTSIATYKTTGDRVQDRFLHEIGGKGLFIKELEQALLEHQADLAVHSLKDLPVRLAPQFNLCAVLPRHSPADALILAPHLAKDLPKDITTPEQLAGLGVKTIATGSLRRRFLLQRYFPSWQVLGIRGNIDSRIAKLQQGAFDALLLAEAGLERLQLQGISWVRLCPSWFIPCAGQGALAIETRAEDQELAALLEERLQCAATRRAIEVERTLLAELGGDCTMPFGCFVSRSKQQQGLWQAQAIVLGFHGQCATANCQFDDQASVHQVATELLAQLRAEGVAHILAEIRSQPPPSTLPS